MNMTDKADFKQSREVPRKPFGELIVKVDVDASDAITALKAIQREARKATQALRELESEALQLEAVATLHVGEVVIPKKTVEEMLREWRELAEQVTKPATNITVNIPEIKASDKADVEKIAKELAEKIRQTREVSKRE